MGKKAIKGGKGPLPHLRQRTTRSSRGRLIQSTSSPSLPDQLRLLGLYAAPTLGDGNCLFRALADQVYGSPVRHADVRRDVCDWIEKWGERYEGFVEFEGDEESDKGRGSRTSKRGKDKDKSGEGNANAEGSMGTQRSRRLEAYLRNMRENGTYGGHMELSAFAHMTRRNVKVVQPGLVYVIEWRAGSGLGEGSSSAEKEKEKTEPPAAAAGESASSRAPESSSSSSSKPKPKSSLLPASPTTSTSSTLSGRRATRSVSHALGSPPAPTTKPKAPPKDKDAGKTKVKTGHGYYVLEEVSSDEEEEGGDYTAVYGVDGSVGGGNGDTEERGEEDEEKEEERVVEELTKACTPTPTPASAPVPVEGAGVKKEVEVDEEAGGPTVYVAYHDWEHFSSIRNLRGPHSGLPNIQETPAHPYSAPISAPVSSTSTAAPHSQDDSKEALKEREREKKREKKEKEKERERERREKGALRVKLKLPGSASLSHAGSPAPVSAVMGSSAAADVVAAAAATDPSKIPLPTSRSASPFPTSSASASTSASSSQPPLPPSQLHTSHVISPNLHARHMAHLQASSSAANGRSQHRSPKRSFDESSASGGDDKDNNGEKRSRRRMGSVSVGVSEGVVPSTGVERESMDVDVDGEGEVGTPGLSAPGSSSSETSSEVVSEEEEEALSPSVSASVSPSPPPDIDVEEDMEDATVLAAATPAPTQTLSPPHTPSSKNKPKSRKGTPSRNAYTSGTGEKELTRRQRKALGLPKPRTHNVSAGKIVIPGGRWTGREVTPGVAGVGDGTDADAEEEWRRNGTGRLDVRGFRELKI